MVLEKPIPFADSEKADIVIMFGARDSNTHIEEGIRSIVALLDNNDTMAELRTARSREGGCRITMNETSDPRLQNGHFNQRHSGVGGRAPLPVLLAETFSLPVLTIDGIKEPFMARLAPVDRPMNRQLGCAAYEVIYVDCRRIACQHGLVDRRPGSAFSRGRPCRDCYSRRAWSR